MGPWERYIPKEGLEILFLTAGDVDWYKYREQVKTKYLLMLDTRSVIIQAESDDKAQIFPEGLFTLEVDTLPEDWEPYKYQYSESGYHLYEPTDEEIRTRNIGIQSKLINRAVAKLMNIHGLILAGVASDGEIKEFETLKSYIQALKDVNIMEPKWPLTAGFQD